MVARFDDSRDDRRVAQRIRLSTEVSVESASHVYAGVSRDISRGGVFVATHHMLPIGTDVRVQITLSNGSLSIDGTVRWQRDIGDDVAPGLGIAFTRLEPAQLELLGSICDEREPYFYEFDE